MYRYIILFITLILTSFYMKAQEEIKQNGYNVFYYPNGQKSSEGNFMNGKPEGFWKNYFETGVLKSEGNRQNHELDSTWLFYYANGFLKEKIEYSKSIKSGESLQYSEEGYLISSLTYKKDTITGTALYYFTDIVRVQYEKPYVKGMLSGRGYEYGRDGRIISFITYEKGVVKGRQDLNSYNAKNQKIGLWITFYEDIDTHKAKQYEGRYKDGLRNGYFREYDKNGVQISTTKYINGEVVENAEELMSVDMVREYHSDASVKWEKTYFGSQPHGIWKEYDTTGVVINSIIYTKGIKLGEGVVDSKGIKQGSWKEYYVEGELRGEGDYIDGARVGSWKFYHPNGKLEQFGKYRKGGKPHGVWIWYYENGAIRREENYINGKEDGEVIEYSEDGEILEQGEYFDGLKEGEWVLNTGDYIEKGTYAEGMMQGEWTGRYKSTNKLAFKGNYIENEPDGKHSYYYPNGRKMLEGKYQLGRKVGDWKRYDNQGLLVLTIRYRNGVAQKIGSKKVIGNPEEE